MQRLTFIYSRLTGSHNMFFIKSFKSRLLISILVIFCATPVNANLIVNGSFEHTATGSSLGGGGGWKYYSASDIDGWDGSNLELWGTLGIASFLDNYHAELNAHGSNGGSWAISQTFNTIVGNTYDLFFAYSARMGSAISSNEAFSISIAGLTEEINDHVVGVWSTYSNSFVADDTTATLTFTSVDQHRWTYGNFLDDIRVSEVSEVSEPSAIALWVLGILGLGAIRRKV
jgi:hypothetical protein